MLTKLLLFFSLLLSFNSLKAKECQALFVLPAQKSFKAQEYHKTLSWVLSGQQRDQRKLVQMLEAYFKLSRSFENHFLLPQLLKDTYFLDKLIYDNNVMVQRLKKILDALGEKAIIESVILNEPGFPERSYFRLDLGVLDAPHIKPLKKLKLFKDHDGVSHIYFDFVHTGVSSAYGYFNSGTRHIVLGKSVMDAILKYGDSSTTTLHEFSHAALTHNSRFPYNLGFLSKKPFYEDAMYPTYMSSQELYTFANTLFVRAKAIAKPFERTQSEMELLLEALFRDSQRLEKMSLQSVVLSKEFIEKTSTVFNSQDLFKNNEGNILWMYRGQTELGHNEFLMVKDYKKPTQRALIIKDTSLPKSELALLNKVQSLVHKYGVESVSALAKKSLSEADQITLRFFIADSKRIQKQLFKSVSRAQYELAMLGNYYLEKLPQYNQAIQQAFDLFNNYKNLKNPSYQQQIQLETTFQNLFELSRQMSAKSRPEYKGYIGNEI
ncbi:MAG: hypothetical protein MK008_10275 [Bdellovibrionales bacterium]|nr:hypothetical protein [Bdellovibrionales bacterium]